MILHWRVKGKRDLYSRWKHVHACFSAYVWQKRSSPTFCNYFSQQIPINPNTQICSMLGGYVCGNFIKEQYRTLPSILSCHQYPFAWLLCLDLALECNILGMFSRTGLSPIPRNNTVRYTSTSPVRASQTNHFLNTKKQSSSFLRKILLTKSTMLFQMRKSAQRITLMQRT